MGDPKPMLPATPLAAGNAAYIEEQYERYLADPNSVAAPWREYFASLGGQGDRAHGPIVAELAQRGATSAHHEPAPQRRQRRPTGTTQARSRLRFRA